MDLVSYFYFKIFLLLPHREAKITWELKFLVFKEIFTVAMRERLLTFLNLKLGVDQNDGFTLLKIFLSIRNFGEY